MRSRDALERALQKTEESLRNVKKVGNELRAVHSLIARLPQGLEHSLGTVLTGETGPLKQQARALSATAQQIRRRLAALPRHGGTRRNRGRKGTRKGRK